MPGSDRIGAICYNCGAYLHGRHRHGTTCPVQNKDPKLYPRHLKYSDLEKLATKQVNLLCWPNFQQSINHGVIPVTTNEFDADLLSPVKDEPILKMDGGFDSINEKEKKTMAIKDHAIEKYSVIEEDKEPEEEKKEERTNLRKLLRSD